MHDSFGFSNENITKQLHSAHTTHTFYDSVEFSAWDIPYVVCLQYYGIFFVVHMNTDF